VTFVSSVVSLYAAEAGLLLANDRRPKAND